MKKITRSALLPYAAEKVYALVNDVASYPEFLPWCGGSEVIEQTADKMKAGVTIAKMGIRQTFITENRLIPNESIEMRLVEGPFKTLSGKWQFKRLADNACKIEFEVNFEVSNGVLNAALGSVFEQIASTFVQSFCERAKQVYGKAL